MFLVSSRTSAVYLLVEMISAQRRVRMKLLHDRSFLLKQIAYLTQQSTLLDQHPCVSSQTLECSLLLHRHPYLSKDINVNETVGKYAAKDTKLEHTWHMKIQKDAHNILVIMFVLLNTTLATCAFRYLHPGE